MTEAQKYVWQGAIPLRIHLHESEVTSHPPPPPAHVLAPRIGYLPLLLPLFKPYFCAALPPGHDTPWFEYRGLPLKWYIPTGVLFDLLCAEPERPWNLTVHFRGYPNILIPCEGEDSVKWSFISSLKEADYIINGNCKNVMHMSQHDQVDLWRSVMDANLEAYIRASSKLKFGLVEDEYSLKTSLSSVRLPKTDKIPVRLYVLDVCEDFEDLEDVPEIACWDKISYMNRPLEILEAEDKCFTLYDALKAVVPELFDVKPGINDKPSVVEEGEEEQKVSSDVSCTGRTGNAETRCQSVESWRMCRDAKIKLVRIQGIEPRLDIPFSWVALQEASIHKNEDDTGNPPQKLDFFEIGLIAQDNIHLA